MRVLSSVTNSLAVRRDRMAYLRGKLLAKRRSLVEFLQAESLENDEPGGVPKDSAEMACSTSGREASYELGAVESHAIEQIDRALQKMDEGTYGICESCGRSISAARLDAIPCACLCLACKRRQEEQACMHAEEKRADLSDFTLLHGEGQAEEHSPEISTVTLRGRPYSAWS